MTYLTRVITEPIPQSEPLDERQAPNSAGGYSYPVSDWTRLDRFLILGSEGGSYYASERKLTLENAEAVRRCAQEDGQRVVERIVGDRGHRARPQGWPAPSSPWRSAPQAGTRRPGSWPARRLPGVARTATHLMQFVGFSTLMRGWGRGLRSAVRDWYLGKDPKEVAYQVVKYRQREGWDPPGSAPEVPRPGGAG